MNWLEPTPLIQRPAYGNHNDWIQMNNGCPQELPPDFEMIANGSTPSPSHVKWCLPHLYRIDANGNRRVWQIGFDGNCIWILHGSYTSTMIDTREIVLNSSGRNLVQQALLETANLFKKKAQRGYAPLDNNFRPVLVGMKGNPIKPNSKIDWSRGMIADTKIDGLRMTVQSIDGKITLRSNGNESYDHLTHIKDELSEFIFYLPSNCVIDGELYCHGMTLPQINSAVRTYIKFNPESLKIRYYIHDLDWGTKPFTEERYEVILNAFNRFHADRQSRNLSCNALTYTTKWMIYSYEDCILQMTAAVSEGYEGLILRHPGRNAKTKKQEDLARYRYGPSRTTALYKVKHFETEEAPVIGVIPGEGRDTYLGILQLRDQKTGGIITIRWGKDSERSTWLQNPSTVIGRVLQYKYMFRDKNSGAPNIVSGVGWRDVYY